MIYEFECAKGHVTEANVPMGTQSVPCGRCNESRPEGEPLEWAKRILSPTGTTFKFADRYKGIVS